MYFWWVLGRFLTILGEVDPPSQVNLKDSRGGAASNIFIVGVKAYLNYCRQPTIWLYDPCLEVLTVHLCRGLGQDANPQLPKNIKKNIFLVYGKVSKHIKLLAAPVVLNFLKIKSWGKAPRG